MRSESVDDRDAWRRLCELLDDDPLLARTVERAAADPSRGSDPWMTLIDGLDDAGALAYLDEHDSGIELAEALPQIPLVHAAGVDLDHVGDLEGDLSAAIALAESILAAHDLRIIRLEEDDDACPLVVVPRENGAEIVALASRMGRDALTFSP